MNKPNFTIHHTNVLFDSKGNPKVINIIWFSNELNTYGSCNLKKDSSDENLWIAETQGYDTTHGRDFLKEVLKAAAQTNTVIKTLTGNNIERFADSIKT